VKSIANAGDADDDFSAVDLRRHVRENTALPDHRLIAQTIGAREITCLFDAAGPFVVERIVPHDRPRRAVERKQACVGSCDVDAPVGDGGAPVGVAAAQFVPQRVVITPDQRAACGVERDNVVTRPAQLDRTPAELPLPDHEPERSREASRRPF